MKNKDTPAMRVFPVRFPNALCRTTRPRTTTRESGEHFVHIERSEALSECQEEAVLISVMYAMNWNGAYEKLQGASRLTRKGRQETMGAAASYGACNPQGRKAVLQM
jgi:hypothetical protein